MVWILAAGNGMKDLLFVFDIGFWICQNWIKHLHAKNDLYEYIAVYVNNLAIVSKNVASIVVTICDPTKLNFKVKGTGPNTLHLSSDFFCDENGTLCFAPKKYIEKMVSYVWSQTIYQNLFATEE